MSFGNEYRIDLKVRNNLILEKIEERGFASIRQFCLATKVSYDGLHKIVNLSREALHQNGGYRQIVYQLCDIFNCLPEELFSATQMETALESNKRTVKVQEAEMRFMLENQPDQKLLEEIVYEDQKDQTIEEILKKRLTPREERVIRLRLGFEDRIYTLREVGAELGVQQERARQIEAKALRKLRHPDIAEKLKEFMK